MRSLGLALIALGFLGGCLVAVMDLREVDFTYFLPFFFLGVAGVVLAQIARRRQATHADTLTANLGELEVSLGNIVERISRLDDEKETVDVYDLPQRIEEAFPAEITTFVEARESLIHLYGMQQYADIMGDFAAAERYLNRVWSAAAEGYIDEAHTYLTRSREQFAGARGKLERAKR